MALIIFLIFMSTDQGSEVSTSFAFLFYFIFLILFLYFLFYSAWKGGNGKVGFIGCFFFFFFFFNQRRNTWALVIGVLFVYLIFVSPASRIGWTAATDESFSGREARSS